MVYDNEPTNYQESMIDSKSVNLKEVIESEMQYMYDNQVCVLVDWSADYRIVGWKYVFKKKTNIFGPKLCNQSIKNLKSTYYTLKMNFY